MINSTHNMSSSHGSSKARTSAGNENIIFNVHFSLEMDIQDVVRLGAFGKYREARSLVDNSLKQLDYFFPIAVEIMRPMYDQGDITALYDYTIELITPANDRRKHPSWTAKELCILHLMHDVCAALNGTSQSTITTFRDMAEANLNIRKFEELDDEQVSCIFTWPISLQLTHSRHS
jgi:hypothetical protein